MVKVNRKIPSEQIRLLIFDLDGTLVNSRTDLANSINAMLRHYGRHELPAELIASYIGDGAPMLVRRSLGDPRDEHFLHEALKYFLDYYREHKLDHTYVYEGVFPALRALRHGANVHPRTMAVLSNKPVGPSRAIVQSLGLSDFFFRIYGGNSFETKKPDPLGIETLLREAQVSKEECVIIGDSDVDVVTVRNAEIYSIGCSYGLAPHTLQAAPPDVLVDSPMQWMDVLA